VNIMGKKKYFRAKEKGLQKWKYVIKNIGGQDLEFIVDCSSTPWTITPISGVEIQESFNESVLRVIIREEVSRALSSKVTYRKVEEEFTVEVKETNTHILEDVPSGPPIGMNYGEDHPALMDEIKKVLKERKKTGRITNTP